MSVPVYNKSEPSKYDVEFIYPSVCQGVYSAYLNGMSVEAIHFGLVHHRLPMIGWEKHRRVSLSVEDIEKIIDLYNEMGGM